MGRGKFSTDDLVGGIISACLYVIAVSVSIGITAWIASMAVSSVRGLLTAIGVL